MIMLQISLSVSATTEYLNCKSHLARKHMINLLYLGAFWFCWYILVLLCEIQLLKCSNLREKLMLLKEIQCFCTDVTI